MYRDTIFQYVKKQYGTIPEYLWNDLPDSAILRNDNGKWYAVFMNLEVLCLILRSVMTAEQM